MTVTSFMLELKPQLGEVMAATPECGIIPIDALGVAGLDDATTQIAMAAGAALVDKFEPEGLDANRVGLVIVDDVRIIMDVARDGLEYKARYSDEDRNFVVDVNGQLVDTRAAMTEKGYRAFVAAAKATRHVLPDTEFTGKFNTVHPKTLLTGEDSDDNDLGVTGRSYLKIGYVDEDGNPVIAVRDYPGLRSQYDRFRPGIDLNTLL